MSVGVICVSNFLRLCKRCYAYAVALISLFVIFQSYAGLFVINRKSYLQLITVTENDSRSSVSMVYQYRLRALNESCNYSHSKAFDMHTYTGESLLREHPGLKSITLLLQSHSLMYCGVPKVATKALLTTMIYVHLRDISEHLNNNWTNIDAATARMEQRINISGLIQELRKVR